MYYVIYLVLAVISLFSEETALSDPVALGLDPSYFVHGCVNVLTGDVVLKQDDLIVQGAEPIVITRTYLGKSAKNSGRWYLPFHHLYAKMKKELFYPFHNNVTKRYFLVPEKNGIMLTYLYDITSNQFFVDKDSAIGLTNCYSGQISARLNLLNNTLCSNAPYKSFTVYRADGGIRNYEMMTKKPKYPKVYYRKHPLTLKSIAVKKITTDKYKLLNETLPNGNQILYEYDEQERISKISTVGYSTKTVFAWITFSYEEEGCKIQTSDQRTLLYRWDGKEKNRFRLTSAKTVENPDESYTYENTVIQKQSFPDGRFLSFTYSPCSSKVSSLLGPTDTQEAKVKYSFSYLDGSTMVRDAYQNATRYTYNEDYLLTRIDRYQNKKTIASEKMYWGKKGTQNQNWLLKKSICSPQGTVLATWRNIYDKKGNITKKKFYGNLLGEENQNNDCHVVYYGYKDTLGHCSNRQNLLYEKKEGKTKTVYFYEVFNSDLISQKRIYEIDNEGNTTLKIIKCFEYNKDNLLTKIITYNGYQETETYFCLERNDEDLEKQIQTIHRRKQQQFSGLPEQVVESYYDFQEDKQKQIKRTFFHYSIHGQIIQADVYDAHDTFCYSTAYAYDEKGRLIEKKDPLGRIYKAQYDQNNNLIFEKKANQDFTIERTFDFANRETALLQKGQEKEKLFLTIYNDLNQKIMTTDPQGNSTFYAYDFSDYPTKITYPPIQKQTPIIEKKYDAFGNVIENIDAKGYSTKTFYTSRNQPYKIIYPDGSEERFIYDIEGKLSKHIQVNKTEIHYQYDYLNRIIAEKTVSSEGTVLQHKEKTYNAFHLLSEKDIDGTLTEYTYDFAGRRKEKIIHTKKYDRKTSCHYDTLGRLVETRKYLSPSVYQAKIQVLDFCDRVLEEIEKDHTGKIYSHIYYTYDSFDNLISTKKRILDKESVFSYVYDSFKRKIYELDPLGNGTQIFYDDAYLLDDHAVIQKTTVDSKNRKTIETFNTQGKIALLEKFSSQEDLLVKEAYFYDLNLNKIQQKSHLFFPEKTFKKTWEYDCKNRIMTLTEQDTKQTKYTYTPSDKIKTLTKPNGTILSYFYDALDRKIAIRQEEKTLYTLSYDKLSRIIEAKDSLEKITKRSYDPFGNLVKETFSHGHTLRSTYDPLGRKTSLCFSDGSMVYYDYDPFHLKKIYRKDAQGNILYTHTFNAYACNHFLIEETFANGLTLTYDYDLEGALLSLTSPLHTQNIEQKDPCGKILSYYTKLHKKYLTLLSYDDLDQLTKEKGLKEHAYRFDSHYNRLAKDDQIYQLNNLYQIEAVSDQEYSNDYNGNRTGNSTTKYLYDAFDRLTTIISAEQTTEFTYDYFDRLVSQKTTSSQEDYFFDGRLELGSVNTLRILAPGKQAEIGATIAVEDNQEVLTPLHDLFGNIIAYTDSKKEIQSLAIYSSFGQVEEHIGSFFPWGYQSKRQVEDLVHFGKRFYDPNTGRFLSCDPKGFKEGPNLYAYVLNDPYSFYDLWGEEVENRYWDQFWHSTWQMTAGLCHGVTDFTVNSGLSVLDMGMMGMNACFPKSYNLWDNYSNYRNDFTTFIDNSMQSIIPADQSNPTYQWFRTNTCSTLDYGSMVLSGVGMAKGIAKQSTKFFTKKSSKMLSQEAKSLGQMAKPKKFSTAKPSFESHSNNWTKNSFFKDKSIKDLQKMFENKGFEPKGKNPIKSYLNPKNNRKYYLDPKNRGRYREPNYIDISRAGNYKKNLKKKRMDYADE